eukprot:965573-Pelagomonas_calceolata.AAC.7
MCAPQHLRWENLHMQLGVPSFSTPSALASPLGQTSNCSTIIMPWACLFWGQSCVACNAHHLVIVLHRGPPRPFGDPVVESILRDMLDGFFPGPLKKEFPEGVPIKVSLAYEAAGDMLFTSALCGRVYEGTLFIQCKGQLSSLMRLAIMSSVGGYALWDDYAAIMSSVVSDGPPATMFCRVAVLCGVAMLCGMTMLCGVAML